MGRNCQGKGYLWHSSRDVWIRLGFGVEDWASGSHKKVVVRPIVGPVLRNGSLGCYQMTSDF